MSRFLSGCFLLAAGGLAVAVNGCVGSPSDGFFPSLPAQTPGVVHPIFGATKVAVDAPPPISGGTLLIARDGLAVAADPDRDAMYIVDLASHKVTTIPMQKGDEPGRLVEDAQGRVHVVLRTGGALATIDLASKSVVDSRSICVAPRGVGFDPSDQTLYVACASGELVQLPAAGGPATRMLQIDRDLRDVVVKSDRIVVSQFRASQAIVVDKKQWVQTDHWVPPASSDQRTPAVAWRTLSSPGTGRTVMLHQRGPGAEAPPVQISEGGYASGTTTVPSTRACSKSIVETAVSFSTLDRGTAPNPGPNDVSDVSTSVALSGAVVPVDLAVSPDGNTFAIAAAGNAFTPGAQSVLVYDAGAISASFSSTDCAFPAVTMQPPGQASAVAFTSTSRLVVQTREPAALFMPDDGTYIRLSTISREDTGHDIFHSNSGGEIACASCHPEGGDDGRVWSFDSIGARRTPSLRGTVPDTAPYHWAGEMADFDQLAHDVFSKRMAGPDLPPDQTGALSQWVNRIPAPTAPAAADAAAVARGKALFEGKADCATCHNGPRFTNNETVDVGTGARFQVPSLLGVAYRAPFQHDGCAASLTDRFKNPSCSTGLHGKTATLSDSDVADIVAYLSTL